MFVNVNPTGILHGRLSSYNKNPFIAQQKIAWTICTAWCTYCVVRWHKYVLFTCTCMFVFQDADVQIWFMRTTRRRLCADRFCANKGIKSLTISRCTHRGHSLPEIYYRRQIRGMSIVPFFTQSILNVIRCLTRFLQMHSWSIAMLSAWRV